MNVHTDGPGSLLGRLVDGYRLTRVLGQGVTGAVYLGINRKGNQVAVKILLVPWQTTTEDRQEFYVRFRREAQVLLSLQHPNILTIVAFGEEGNLPYMILPYLAGGTLTDYLKQRVALLPLEVINHDLRQLTDALAHAHRRNILHRDIKPSNILFDAQAHIYLTDFSIAGFLETTATNQTTAGRLMGTPLYMAPEVARGERATPAADLYSLGVVLYEMVTGQPPFQGSGIDVLTQHVMEPPPLPHGLRPDLPPLVENVILRALAKRPEARFPTAEAFGLAFDDALVSAHLPPTTFFPDANIRVTSPLLLNAEATLPSGRWRPEQRKQEIQHLWEAIYVIVQRRFPEHEDFAHQINNQNERVSPEALRKLRLDLTTAGNELEFLAAFRYLRSW